MLVSLLFDTEDYTSPAALGLDDIPGWLARIMTEEGVTGTFLVIPRKARTMLERGRDDVIAALRRHEIGLHTARGSEHPTVVEYLEGCSWDDGVAKALESERAGIAELEAVFETEVSTCSRHGASWGPQFVAACGRLGRPVVYSHAAPRSCGIGWYAGALNLRRWTGLLERDYSEPDRLERRLESLDRDLTEAAKTEPWIGLFCAHPEMIKALEFWDGLNYADGENRPPTDWRAPACRSDAAVRQAQDGFRRLVRFVRDHSGVEVAPVAEVVRRFGLRRNRAARPELLDLARKALATGAEDVFNVALLDDETLSPAQQALGFARALLAPEAQDVEVGDPLGPTDDPLHACADLTLDRPALVDLAAGLDRAVRRSDRMPGNLSAAGRLIGLGAVYFALAEALVRQAAGEADPRVHPPYYAPQFPAQSYRIGAAYVNDVAGWPIHKPHIDTDELLRLTRLMTWSLRRPTAAT
jgi:hypothetical protein